MNEDEVVLNGLRVLVVDDNADNRDFIEFLLQEYGAKVVAAASAVEALEIFALVKPAILITDISMPDKDGFWLISQIRSLEASLGGTIPAIAFTGTNIEAATEAGFQVYLRKPVDPTELVLAVAQLAGNNL